MSTHRHWGDLIVIPDSDPALAAREREQMNKQRLMEVEGPRLHQPSSKHCPPGDHHPAELFTIDSLTLHTIKLVQYARQMRALVNSVQQQRENWKPEEGEVPTYPTMPQLPEHQGPPRLDKLARPFPFMPKDLDSEFVRGIGKPPPEIDSSTCRKLLRRSVAAVCAHTGYDNCAESVLDTMTDLTHEYFLQMTKLLRTTVDNEALRGTTGFPDAIQQVFQELGIGKLNTIHDFYQTRIVNYHDHMLQVCHQLIDEFEKSKHPEYKAMIKVKEEPLSDIHFPTTDEVEEMLDSDGILHLEGLGLDISVVQEEEEESKWNTTVKTEPVEAKTVKLELKVKPSGNVKQTGRVSTLDAYDQEESQSLKADTPHTPQVGSESGDIPEPGSVPASDIMSPPSAGIRPPKAKKKKRS